MQKKHLCHFGCILLLGLGSAESTKGQDITKPFPLSLNQAVERALANNLNLKLQSEEIHTAEGATEIAKGKFDTLLTASLSGENTEVSVFTEGYDGNQENELVRGGLQKQLTTGTQLELGWKNSRFDYVDSGLFADPVYNSTISLGFSQPLTRGLGTDIQTAAIEAAQKNLASSSFAVDSLAADLAAQVKGAYWDLVYAWQDIEVKRLSLTLANKLLEETDAKIKAGRLADVDIYQPQSEVARREEFLIAAERAIGVAEDELKLLLNSEEWLVSFAPIDQPITEPHTLNQQTILDNALKNRPDLKAADLSVEAGRLQQDIAENNTQPELTVVGGVGHGGSETQYGNALNAAVDDPENSWQIGLNFSMPLDNSLARGALMQAKASYNSAKIKAELLRLEVRKSVRTTVRDVELAIKAMEATKKTSLASSKRLEAEQAKFAAGRATTLDVLIAQDAYSQALSLENQTRVTYAKALAEIDRIQGKITMAADY